MTLPEGDPGTFRITLRDVYNLVQQVIGELRTMTVTATLRADQQAAAELRRDHEHQDHETRIRGLERWRYALPVALVLAVGSIAAEIMMRVWGH